MSRGIPAGLENSKVEFFINSDDDAKVIHDEKCVSFMNTEDHVRNTLISIMKKDREGYPIITEYFKIQDVNRQAIQYIKCTSPNINSVADIDDNNHYNKEIHDCNACLICKGFGKLCKAPQGPGGQLTKKETSVFFLTCKGLLDKEIAEILGNKINTIDVYQRSVRSKLSLNNRTECILFAVRNGINIDPNI